jgi:hypothetical protein
VSTALLLAQAGNLLQLGLVVRDEAGNLLLPLSGGLHLLRRLHERQGDRVVDAAVAELVVGLGRERRRRPRRHG